jgi:metal-sulfur cluster biosynthetic enzyme
MKEFAGDVVRSVLADDAGGSAGQPSPDRAAPAQATPAQPESARKWHGAVHAASMRTSHQLSAGDSPRDERYASDDPVVDRLWRALCEVADPELPVSLVDLGLIRAVHREDRHVRVELTFTASACPCMAFIVEDVKERLLREDDVDRVTVRDVWDPPWTTADMTDHGRALLRSFGVAA